MVRRLRNIIKIDEEKCTGCGKCVVDCEEGALEIIEGKAKVVKESYCDGLGACIGSCPEGALSLERREAEEFDEVEVEKQLNRNEILSNKNRSEIEKEAPIGCPALKFENTLNTAREDKNEIVSTELTNWPIQLKLINPNAPYFENSDLLITSDCVPFTYPNFHKRFLKDKILIILCPKLDSDLDSYVEKLTDIIKDNDINSITMVRMEIPCCRNLENLVVSALKKAGKTIILKDYIISVQGNIV
jgi:NAD-dependent dihydropyrimidine dehydrogenase PreA subunit